METKQKKTNDAADYKEIIQKFVNEIQYGTVTIVVQEGKIVQIEKMKSIE